MNRRLVIVYLAVLAVLAGLLIWGIANCNR